MRKILNLIRLLIINILILLKTMLLLLNIR